MKPYIDIILGTEVRAGAQHNGFVFSAYNSNFARVEREDDETLVVYPEQHNINFELFLNGERTSITFDKADPNFRPVFMVKNLEINNLEDKIVIRLVDLKVSDDA